MLPRPARGKMLVSQSKPALRVTTPGPDADGLGGEKTRVIPSFFIL